MAAKSITRKIDGLVMIETPAEMEVEEGKEFLVYKKGSGSILLVPKIEDYFINAKKGEFHTPLEWEDLL